MTKTAYPPRCECEGKIVIKNAQTPTMVDTDGDNPPGIIHLSGHCVVCGQKYDLEYIFDEVNEEE